MRRQLEPTALDTGTWLRLDCGHPAPPQLRGDGTADCVHCDRSPRTAARPTTGASGHR
jgi:hypothetical protein